MNQPIVSVVVVNWNGKETVQDCLDSVIGQTYPNVELVVVDNASEDGSDHLILEKYPSVRFIAFSENRGFAVGCNVGIKESKGEFVALLNNDAIVDPDWISELVKAIESDPAIGSCASLILHDDASGKIDSAGEGLSLCGVPYKRGSGKPEEEFLKSEPVFGACAGAALYRRSLFEDVGLFDEDFFIIYEDGDLSFRAQLLGYKCLYVPSARVRHRINYSIGSFSRTYVFFGHRNVEILFFKNVPNSHLLRYFHHHVLYVFLSFFLFLWKGRGGTFLKSKWDFFRSLRKTWAKRREVQSRIKMDLDRLEEFYDRNWIRTRIFQKW